MALVGIELEWLDSESDALTTRPPKLHVFHQTGNTDFKKKIISSN